MEGEAPAGRGSQGITCMGACECARVCAWWCGASGTRWQSGSVGVVAAAVERERRRGILRAQNGAKRGSGRGGQARGA